MRQLNLNNTNLTQSTGNTSPPNLRALLHKVLTPLSKMLRQRLLGSSTLVLLAYLTVNTLVILSNPPKYVTRTTDYVGAPIGDLSDAVRIQLAGKVTDGSYVSEVQWEPDVYACGFSFNWYSIHGALGNKYTQNEGLCVRSSAVDFYS